MPGVNYLSVSFLQLISETAGPLHTLGLFVDIVIKVGCSEIRLIPLPERLTKLSFFSVLQP